MSFIVIEGDNGTGKTTVANMFKENGFAVISEEPDIINMSIESKKYAPGSEERFNAFVKYNEVCLERSTRHKNSLIVRSWISTVSAAYADGKWSLDETLQKADEFLNKYPIPDLIIRLECEYSERLKRIHKRFEETNDISDDISRMRDEKYQEILFEIKRKFPNWIDLDTTKLNPMEVYNKMQEIIKNL